MRSLVTGGAGFIGSNLVDALVLRGDTVTVIDNLATGKREHLDQAIAGGAELQVLDIRDAAAVGEVFAAARPELVFHLAAQIDVRHSVENPAADADVNVLGTIAVLDAALASGAQKVINTSTGGGLYGDVGQLPTPEDYPIRPLAPYGQGKYAAEGYCGLYTRLHELATVSLRYGNVYGLRQDVHGEAGVVAIFCGHLIEGRRPTVFGDGRQTSDWVDVSDVVRANLMAAESDLTGRSTSARDARRRCSTCSRRSGRGQRARTSEGAGVRPGASGGGSAQLPRYHAGADRAGLGAGGRPSDRAAADPGGTTVTASRRWDRLAEHPVMRRAMALGPKRTDGHPSPADFSRNLVPAQLALDTSSATQLLYDRLTPDDVEEVIRQARTAPDLAELPQIGDDHPGGRRWLVLNYGTWLRVPAVTERTGLPAAQPPEAVHAMARGPLSAAGGLGEADMIVDALRSAGVAVADVGPALDFGCSSGRVVRVLAAAFPDIQWHACDPNEGAVEWASEHLPAIEFFVSPQTPPLPIREGALGLAYAISIWSHFAPDFGLRWFDEMHRMIRPGGHLVFTTHGMQSVAFAVAEGMRSPEQCRQIVDGLYRDGFWYAAEFGPLGDAGIVNPDWGTCFLSAEWLLTKLCPGWHVLEFAPGRNQLNQDIYVLERV